MGSMPQPHARGYSGEQSMGFFLGERGYFFVDGPSGAGGHRVTDKGFDGVAFNPQTHDLIVYDNKAFADTRNVSSAKATAIDPAQNLGKNFDNMIQRVQGMNDLPNKAEILGLLCQTRTALQNGASWPSNVEIAVSNASGRSGGVSSGLSGSGIRFIDYYNAPRPAPSNPAPPSPGGTEAKVGTARTDIPGAGPLPGITTPALDVAAIHMIIRNGLTQVSLVNAGNEAMQAYLHKKPEIERLRSANPGFGVRLDFYWQFQPGVNRDFNDTWRFEELTVASEASGYQGMVTDTLARGELKAFTGFLPALDPSAKPLQSASTPSDSWYQRYLLVRKAYDAGMPPYTECFQVLNGSNMYDIVRVLDKLVDDKLFNLFQNSLPSVPGIGTERLAAAFGAVRATWGGGNALDSYVSQYGKEFGGLFPDQQNDIKQFMQLKAVRKSLIGKWQVQVDKWTWIYEFFDSRYVKWTDPFNNKTGMGAWSVTTDRVILSWAPKSKTTEEWNLPIDTNNETGKCSMAEGTFPLRAVRT